MSSHSNPAARSGGGRCAPWSPPGAALLHRRAAPPRLPTMRASVRVSEDLAMSKEDTAMCLRRVITALMLATLVEAPAQAVADPTPACIATKGRAVGKNASDQMKCQATAAKTGSV